MEITQEWIYQYNRKCAEFLNFFPIEGTEGIWINIPKNFRKSVEEKEHILQYSMMKFHSDWNWIMEICTKISSLRSDSSFEGLNSQVFEFRHTMFWELIDNKNEFLLKIEKFIDWYNKQKEL